MGFCWILFLLFCLDFFFRKKKTLIIFTWCHEQMHGFILEDPEHHLTSMGSLTSLDHSLLHWRSFPSTYFFFFRRKDAFHQIGGILKNVLQFSPLENFPGHPKMCLHICFLWNPFTSPCKTPGSRLIDWKWVFCIETKKTNFCNKIDEAGDHLYETKCGTQKRWGFCVLFQAWKLRKFIWMYDSDY